MNKFQKIIFFLLSIVNFNITFASPKPIKINPQNVITVTSQNNKRVLCAKVKSKFQPGKYLNKSKKQFILSKSVLTDLNQQYKTVKKSGNKKGATKLYKKITAFKKQLDSDTQLCNNSNTPSPTPTPNPTSNTPTNQGTPFPGDPDALKIEQLDRAITNDELALLYERAGFGYTEREKGLIELSGISQNSVSAVVDFLTTEREEEAGILDTAYDLVDSKQGVASFPHTPSGQRQALLYLWANTNNPFSERLALSLLGVWTTAGDVIADETFRHVFWDYYTKIRNNAHTQVNLPDLGVELTRDPLMLIYLNNGENTKKSPNENFARELQELFTMGPEDLNGQPNYTETNTDGSGDIATAARALTGLKYSLNYVNNTIDVTFVPTRHAVGPHTMYAGKPYQFQVENYEDLVRGIFLHHPNVKYFYAKELLKEYLTLYPPNELIINFGEVIAQNNFNLRPALATLFKSKAFYHPFWKDTLPKSSITFAAQALKTLKLNKNYNHGEVDRQMVRMQQPVNLAPSVFWFNSEGWTSPAMLIERANYLSQILGDTTSHNKTNPAWNIQSLLPVGNKTNLEVIEYVRNYLGLKTFNNNEIATLNYYLNTVRWYNATLHNDPYDNQDPAKQLRKGAGLYYLLMSEMWFQLM